MARPSTPSRQDDHSVHHRYRADGRLACAIVRAKDTFALAASEYFVLGHCRMVSVRPVAMNPRPHQVRTEFPFRLIDQPLYF